MSQVTEQSVRFQTALASIKLIQASAVLDLAEDDFDFLTSNRFFFQAEDGIRDLTVTGVQMCSSDLRSLAVRFGAAKLLGKTAIARQLVGQEDFLETLATKVDLFVVAGERGERGDLLHPAGAVI